MDLLEPIFVALIGISEEDCGVRQASIMASDQLHDHDTNNNQITYVNQYMQGMLPSPFLLQQITDEGAWLKQFLDEKVRAASSNTKQ